MNATAPGKPRLVYFQRRFNPRTLVKYVQLHYEQQIKCLSRSFDVTVIREDCDFARVCDTHWPDVALFECGISSEGYRRLEIANLSAHPAVPRVAFYNADAFCRARSAVLSDIERWRLEAVFSLSTVMHEYLPEIAGITYCLPNFIDPDLYRDYGCHKSIPVLFTGSQSSYYPWRRRVSEVVSAAYPTLSSPHLGYYQQAEVRLIFGERYAKMLNATWFAASCGTVAREVVRKHFEIPASRACLLTECTPSVEAAGFKDMENCVFADTDDAVEKIDFLFGNPDRLAEIIDAGYELAHTRHTLDQRGRILEWLTCRASATKNQLIVQDGPFERIRLAEAGAAATFRTSAATDLGRERALLQAGYQQLWSDSVEAAISLFQQCIDCICEIPVPEPRVGLALCYLAQGQADIASGWLDETLQCTLIDNAAVEPDPIEWAYYLIAQLCRGDLTKAGRCAARFGTLRDTELDRARWLVGLASATVQSSLPLPGADARLRPSVHPLARCKDVITWAQRTATLLERCGRTALAARLRGTLDAGADLAAQPA